MAEIATKFPPQTYCSSFFLNALPEEDPCVNGGTTPLGKKRSRNKEPDESNAGPILDCFISAMSPLSRFTLPLFLSLIPLSTPYQTAIECINPSIHQTRTFATLLDYQHNSQSFQVHGADYAGNAVEFGFVSIDRIPRNAFISFTSQYIWKITLKDKQIKQIDDGAFVNLNCLHVLDLQNNSLRGLSEGMFEKLTFLATLKLNDNLIGELRNLVFRHLVGLKSLDLSHNRISSIGVEAFEGLKRLESLDLSGNYLRTIHPETFAPVYNLMTLQLASNRLQNLQPELWKNLTKLETLDLADNFLASFDPAYNFSFNFLKTLNLSMNHMTKFNVHSLKIHLPVLSTIDLNGNPWLCEDLASIIPALRDSRIAHVKTTKPVKNVDGIPCSYNTVTYTEKTTTEATTTTAKATTGAVATENLQVEGLKNASLDIQAAVENSNKEILSSMEKTQNLIVSLIVLVLIFIALELTFRTGLMNRVIRRGSHRDDGYILNDRNVDNIALLRA